MLIEFKPWHLDTMKLSGPVREIAARNIPALEALANAHLVGTIIVSMENPVILGED